MDEIARIIPGDYSYPTFRCSKVIPGLVDGDANPTQAPALLQGSLPGNFVQADARGHGNLEARDHAPHRQADQRVTPA